MKKIILSIASFLLYFSLQAQTINPSCFSNAAHWSITKIESVDDGTYVYLNYYSYKTNYTFWFSPGMYIENAKDQNSPRYHILSVADNQLNTTYRLEPNTMYNFVLKFEKLPYLWTEVNILEPPVPSGYESWYWKYIYLNDPESRRYKIDDFFLHTVADFMETYAHPLNTFRGYRYSINENEIRAVFYYQNGYHTDFDIQINDNLVNRIYVMDDNDEFNPLASLTLIRDLIFKQKNGDEYASEFERNLNKAINNMNGRELSCVYLTALWNIQ